MKKCKTKKRDMRFFHENRQFFEGCQTAWTGGSLIWMYLVKEPGLPADSFVLKRVRNQNRWFLEIQRTVQHCIKKPQEKAFFVFLGKKNLFINFFYKIAFHFSFSFRSLPPIVHPFIFSSVRGWTKSWTSVTRFPTHARPPAHATPIGLALRLRPSSSSSQIFLAICADNLAQRKSSSHYARALVVEVIFSQKKIK